MRFCLHYACGLAAVAPIVSPGIALAGQTEQSAPVEAETSSTPRQFYDMALPLVRDRDVYGDIRVRVYADGTAEFNTDDIIKQIEPMLAPEARDAFGRTLRENDVLTSEAIREAGVIVRYNSELLQVDVVQIDPEISALQVLGFSRSAMLPDTMEPEPFSAYVNAVSQLRYEDARGEIDPVVSMFGAVRMNGLVFEMDAGYDGSLTEPGFYRRAARLVYDDVDAQRRYSLGDLRLDSLQLLGGVFLGGGAVEKGRRVFDPFQPAFSGGAQEIILDQPTTIEVISNGTQIDTLELSPGRYDLSQLPFRYGANDVQLVAVDAVGRRKLSGLDLFYNPYDLSVGEVEYNAAIGYPVSNLTFNPEYRDDIAFSGYYRRGVTNRLVLGGAMQASEDNTVLAGEARFSPDAIAGYVEVSVAQSTGVNSGTAARAGYSYIDPSGTTGRQFSIYGIYEGAGFATLSDTSFSIGQETLTINANFSQRIGQRTTVLTGATVTERDRFESDRTIYGEVLYALTSRVRATAGFEVGNGGVVDNEYGFRVGLTGAFGSRHTATGTYNSRRNQFRGSVSRAYDDKVGGLGYNLGVSSTDSSANADVSVNYIANRFRSRLAYISSGEDFGAIGENNTAIAQLGTSLAYTGGDFAVGRPISDSFAIAKAHESLDEERVIIGDELRTDAVDSYSGAFGPALQSGLYSYSRQTIVYDLQDGGAGIDIGTGLETVTPPYRSGYHITIGSDANVSAVGTLRLGGEPASLLVGTVSSQDDEDYQPERFFTNTIGRFAVIGLRPGKTYTVQLTDHEQSFTIKVPEEGDNLIVMGVLDLAASQKE